MTKSARQLVILLVLLAFLATPAAASAADYTWSGAAPFYPEGSLPPPAPPDPAAINWSQPSNWIGEEAPSGSVGTLKFPFLGAVCIPDPEKHTTKGACYKSKNDLTGISADEIEIGGGAPHAVYVIEGRQIGLGEGGITVTPDIQATAGTEADIAAPLLLGTPQTWAVHGSANGPGSLHIDGKVSSANPLDVALSNGNLTSGGDVETGAISFTGTGSVNLGAALGPYYDGALNGNDGNPVNLGPGLSIFDENTPQFDSNAYDLGSLTLAEHTLLQLGQPPASGSVALSVNGGISFSSTSRLSLLFNSNISASGPVNLNGAALDLRDGTIMVDGSPACNVLDVDKLLTTTGTINGTFGGVPDGGLISLPCGLPVDALARVNYDAHSVTATLVQRTTTSLEVSNTTPPAGGHLIATATVIGERQGDGIAPGTVEFFDGGVPISGCMAQPLAPQGIVSSTSCDLSFPTVSTHEITAAYAGSPTFLASTSETPRLIVVQPAPPGSQHEARHRVFLASSTAPVSAAGDASVTLDCRKARCHGTLTLIVKRGKGTTTIGTARFSIPTGKHRVAVRLNRRGRRLLARSGRPLAATLVIGDSGGRRQQRVHLVLTGGGAGE